MATADLVLQNGKVATVDKDFRFCEAVAVKDGWIIDLGTTEEMAEHVGPETRVIDLEGRVMLPAANDAHLHATLTGLRMGEGALDVGATQSLAELKGVVAKRMGRFGIGCSPQPIAANIVAGMNAPRMTAGEELFNWGAYMKAGCWISGGSDSPCFDFNWRSGVQFAVTRTTAAGQAIRPDLAMSLEDAIRMYTIHGAYQEHMEHVRGSIETGKLADFQVLGRDIFTCPAGEIGQIPVDMTICGGRVVYQA